MNKFYVSTRDEQVHLTSKEAILKGISDDGGLFVWPSLAELKIDLNTICQNEYKENAVYVLSKLLHDFTKEELEQCVHNAYSDSFTSKDITPVRKVGDIYVLELFHGPTSAFKDVALTLLPQLMSVALEKTDQKALILTATSGDTGKAALSGFKDVKNIGIEVFYPDQKVSQMQYRQMASQTGNNLKVLAIKGNFDDAQSKVKELFLDKELNAFAKKHNVMLTSANSINIGRLVPQIVYYFESYKYLVNNGVIKLNDPVSFSVPTGNFGDVLAGYYAYLMGLPVKKFYVASNANHVLTDFLTTGVYDRNRDFVQTISPSMDILISSNLERLLYYMSNQDTKFVKKCMEDLKKKGRYQIPEQMLAKIQSLFGCGYVDDTTTKQVIRKTYEANHVVLDPHSAIAYKVAKDAHEDTIVSLATASPYKFPQDVLAALGEESISEFDAMNKLAQICDDPIPDNLAALQTSKIIHKDVISVNKMEQSVKEMVEKIA